METIKKALLDVSKKGLDVKYISAPRYQITSTGKDIKKVRELVETACEDVVAAVEVSGEASFALEGK